MPPVRYEVRTPDVRDLRDLFDRVVDAAEGCSSMTGTTLEASLPMAFTEYVPNKALGAIASEAMQEVGAPQWDEADFQLARQFLESYDPETRSAVEAEIRRTYGDRAEAVLQRPLATDVIPFDPAHIRLQAGSTDVGDVGYAAPTLNLLVATACVGNVGHSWQMTAQACSPLAHKGLLTAAQAMALSAVRTMHCPEAIAAAKAEVLARNGGKYPPAARFGQAASGDLLMQTGREVLSSLFPVRFQQTHRNSAVRFYFPPTKKESRAGSLFLTVMQSNESQVE